MSSLDHDRPLQEGPAPRQRTGRTLPPAGGTRSRRRAAASSGETVRAGIPSPRRGDPTTDDAPQAARRGPAGGTVRTRAATTADAARTAGAKAAAAAKAAKSSPATAAAAKAARTVAAKAATTAAAKASAAKSAATAKAATAKTAGTEAAPARSTRAATAKPAVAQATTGEASAPTPATRPRPTPRPRPAADAAPVAAEPPAVRAAGTAELVAAGEAQSRVAVEELTDSPADLDVVVVEELEPADATTEPQGWRRRGIARLRRRPALAIAAVVISTLGVGAVSLGTAAEAETAEQPSHSMSVAAELGISSQETLTAPDAHDADHLAELAASRATREAQQAQAAQAQQQADAFAAEAIAEAQRPKAVLPVNGARLTTCFCMRWGTMHWGIDLAAPMLTPEYAAMDGVMLEAGPASGFGQAVYIQHENGDVTVYGHMEQILVHAGQVVKAGDEIALLGSRGQSTGPHLHFEVHQGGINGQKIDPIPWLHDRGVDIG